MKRETQKQEAIKRMKMLKLHENCIREFEQDDVINQSEHGGILYWLDEKQQNIVKKFEAEHGAVVYHAIHNYTAFGELLALLYVSKHKEEWEYDRDDLKEGTALAYVVNIDDEWCSEFGSIGVKPQWGGLCRTA